MQRLNQWLTLLANIGVLIGIVFLAYEIRLNTLSNERDEFQTFAEKWSELTQLLITEPDVTELWLMGMQDHESLTDEEWLRFKLLYTEITTSIANHWRDMELIPDAAGVKRFSGIHAYWYTQPSGKYWWELMTPTLPEAYQEEVMQQIKKLEAGEKLDMPTAGLWLSRDGVEKPANLSQ